MFKFAIIGTACTGKSTVFNNLRKRINSPDFVFVKEAAGEYIARNRSVDLFTHEANIGIQDLVLQREKEAETRGEILVCDRSAICPAVYSLAFGHAEGYQQLLLRVDLT